jgi:hypothetical protein
LTSTSPCCGSYELIEQLQYPCLVKPRESFRYIRAFGVKMHRVEDGHQLREAWHRAHNLGIKTVVRNRSPVRTLAE